MEQEKEKTHRQRQSRHAGVDVYGVKFDTNALLLALQKHIVVTLKLIQTEYLKEVQSHMLTKQGADSLTAEEIEVLGSFITANVIGGAWAAMDNYGTGSRMALDNPALEDYMNSPLWNRARKDIARRGRPKGHFMDIFGIEREYSGEMEGVDLERLARQGILPKSFLPTPPSRAIETAAAWMKMGRLQRIWRESLSTFPWGMFFVVTED